MKQQPTTGKKNNAINVTPAYLQTPAKPVAGDSIEVMETYYRERIRSFSAMLDELNVLEDAPEIEFLCREIIEGRTKLVKLAAQKKFSA